MQFTFETHYDRAALTQMARALRKTVRRKHSRRMHIFGAAVVIFGVYLLTLLDELSFQAAVSFAAILAIGLSLVFEDRLNGYIAQKRMAPGTDSAKARFTAEGYSSESALGRSEWSYENIAALAESERYFVFIFSRSHAQLYDKQSIAGGSAEEFAAFIAEKTGLEIQKI